MTLGVRRIGTDPISKEVVELRLKIPDLGVKIGHEHALRRSDERLQVDVSGEPDH